MGKHGKRLRETYDKIDRETNYDVDEAVKLICESK